MTVLPLGDILKSKREAAGYTQQQLAVKLLVTRQAVSGWERGKSEPDIAIIKQLAALYDISIDDLLSEMDTERAKETLRNAGLVSLFIGFGVFAATLGASLWRGGGGFALLFCFAYTIVLNLVFWFSLTGAISRRSAKGLAGFHPDVTYNKPALCRLLDHQRFWLISITTIASVPSFLTVIFHFYFGYLFTVVFVFFHILALFFSMNYLKKIYADSLFLQPSDKWVKQVSDLPWFLFIVALGITLVVSAIAPEFLGLVNNTAPSMAYAGLLFLACILLVVTALSELGRPEKAAKAGEHFRFRRSTKIIYFVLAAVNVLMVLVFV